MEQRFEKLKGMEAFTERLFDRIFAFQEKQSAAWDPARPFEERIRDIPLHNLIFSNPDRDPATTGPTIAHYYPLREENRALAYYIGKCGDDPLVLDIHARNGFIGSLLAREGVRVVGLRDPEEKPNQIADFFDPDCYTLREGRIEEVDFPVDVVFSSWMPAGRNFTPAIAALRPKMVIYLFTEHVNEHTGERQTGTDDAFDTLPEHYRIIDEWEITRPENLLQEAWPDLSPSIEERRIVRIFADRALGEIPRYEIDTPVPGYPWEEDLEMALLTLEAKAHLRSRGIAV